MNPSLNLAIARLVNTGSDNFAIWVVNAPYPSGYVLRDCAWSENLTQIWQEWQQMFAGHSRLDISPDSTSKSPNPLAMDSALPGSGQTTSYSSRLMQYLGISLWRWVFDGSILNSLERSQGIAMGQNTRLRFRLEIRDPDLSVLPWEIMQREAGQSAISLSQNLLFSRTTSEVESLPYLRNDQGLNILLVLGQDQNLRLEEEAAILGKALLDDKTVGLFPQNYAPCMVNTLVQPTPEELIQKLESKLYNVLFYAGHAMPGADGGVLFLKPGMTLNGMELAQLLTHAGVKLAVFNACSGAQPLAVTRHAMPYSSLAEVLIRQGVPAVLGMRDQIADHESHTFIQSFAQALRKRKSIDEAVAEARQQLLTLYKFNQPAWTLPILYLHPDFDGELLKSFDQGITEFPESSIPTIGKSASRALLRSLSPEGSTWVLTSVVTRIGRTTDNDIVIPEPSVSRRHAEIICRNAFNGTTPSTRTYHLNDLSTHGTTWILRPHGLQQVHRQEVLLEPGTQLKFGSTKSQIWEFLIEDF